MSESPRTPGQPGQRPSVAKKPAVLRQRNNSDLTPSLILTPESSNEAVLASSSTSLLVEEASPSPMLRQPLSPEPGPVSPMTTVGATSPSKTTNSSTMEIDIVYRLEVQDIETRPPKKTMRYQLEPFEDLSGNHTDRQNLSVMDVMSTVEGTWPKGRPKRTNQLRSQFLKGSPSEPFVLGRDFICRSTTFNGIRIWSERLRNILDSLIKYYPGLEIGLEIGPEKDTEKDAEKDAEKDTEKDSYRKPVYIGHPYKPLFNYYHELQELREKCVEVDSPAPPLPGNSESHTRLDKTTKHHLGVLLDFLDEGLYQSHIGPEFELHKRGQASFELLWLLYKPGSPVFAESNGEHRFFIVESSKKEPTKASRFKAYSIKVWSLELIGHSLKRQVRVFKINPYTQAREIQKLPIKPLKYLTSPEKYQETVNSFIGLGKQFIELLGCAPIYRRYDGPLGGINSNRFTGDVVIDPILYHSEMASNEDATMHSKATSGLLAQVGYQTTNRDFGEILRGDPDDKGGGFYSYLNEILPSKEHHFEHEEDYLLLPNRIRGFATREKQWLKCFIEYCVPAKVREKPWDSLVMNEEDRKLVRSLASQANSHLALPWSGDFVSGKGQGQIVLLFGPPGVGKTLTAECIAAQMERPLLFLTAADIGTKETEAEKNLSHWLHRAAQWGAIVLIDEAETFLTQRESGNLKRNALVTAFLRILEYSQGLIFLTTNEIGRFDEAVLSRVHLAIEYRSLDKDDRRHIWCNRIEWFKEEQDSLPQDVARITISKAVETFILDEKALEGYEHLEFSGRDVRNSFQAAVQLARYDGKHEQGEEISLERHHIEKVLRGKLAAKASVNRIYGQTTEQRAAERGGRREPKPKPKPEVE